MIAAQHPDNVVEEIGRGSVIEDSSAKTPGGRRKKA